MTLGLLIALQTTAMSVPPVATALQPRVVQNPQTPLPPPPPPPPRPSAVYTTPRSVPHYPYVAPLTPVQVPGVSGEAFATHLLEVEVRAGREMLWSGTLRAGPSRPASYTREINQAPEGNCLRSNYGRDTEQSSLRLTLSSQLREGGLRIGVGVRWQRPSGGGCEQPGTRTVELSDVIDLTPSAWQTITGDGDLTVRIRRR